MPRYISDEKGIRGILKDTCDDFIVQEIDKNGVVVELKNKEVPEGIYEYSLAIRTG